MKKYWLPAIAALFIGCFSKEKVQQDSTSPPSSDNENTEGNPYTDLRNMALNTSAADLGLSLPGDKTIAFGLVTDWGTTEGSSTTVTYQTGDASLYYSNGGGIIGGGGQPPVNRAARSVIELAQTYLPQATPTQTTPLPGKDEVIFYFLTNKGMYAAKEKMENFENGNSSWLPLFEKVNEVITEFRIMDEKHRDGK